MTEETRGRLRGALPVGTSPVALGVILNGITSYAFLVLPARLGVLDTSQYAAFTRLWFVLFVLAPGLFLPLEQEFARAVAARRGSGRGLAPLMRRGLAWAAVGIAVGFVVALGVGIMGRDRLFASQDSLVLALVLAVPSYGLLHLGRGLLAGSGMFSGYGVTFGGEGLIRLAVTVPMLVAGASTAGPYGLATAVSPLLALALALALHRPHLEPGPKVASSEFGVSLPPLLVAQFLSQALVNSVPIVFAFVAHDDPRAAALSAAVIITRVPLFMYQAVQASLIPRLAHLVAGGRHHEFRSTLQRLLVAMGAVIALGAGAALILGPTVVRIAFGPDFVIDPVSLAVLTVGSGMFVLALAATQALLTLRAPASMVLAWSVGLLLGGLALGVDIDPLTRVTWAFLIATTAAFLTALSRTVPSLARIPGGA